jgi:hypothetical protein
MPHWTYDVRLELHILRPTFAELRKTPPCKPLKKLNFRRFDADMNASLATKRECKPVPGGAPRARETKLLLSGKSAFVCGVSRLQASDTREGDIKISDFPFASLPGIHTNAIPNLVFLTVKRTSSEVL